MCGASYWQLRGEYYAKSHSEKNKNTIISFFDFNTCFIQFPAKYRDVIVELTNTHLTLKINLLSLTYKYIFYSASHNELSNNNK